MANMDITRQAAILNSRISLKDLQDPSKLDRLLSRFTSMYDITQNDNSAGNTLSLLSTTR